MKSRVDRATSRISDKLSADQIAVSPYQAAAAFESLTWDRQGENHRYRNVAWKPQASPACRDIFQPDRKLRCAVVNRDRAGRAQSAPNVSSSIGRLKRGESHRFTFCGTALPGKGNDPLRVYRELPTTVLIFNLNSATDIRRTGVYPHNILESDLSDNGAGLTQCPVRSTRAPRRVV